MPCALHFSFVWKLLSSVSQEGPGNCCPKSFIQHSVVCPSSLIILSLLLQLSSPHFTLSVSKLKHFKMSYSSSGSYRHWPLYVLRNKRQKQRKKLQVNRFSKYKMAWMLSCRNTILLFLKFMEILHLPSL